MSPKKRFIFLSVSGFIFVVTLMALWSLLPGFLESRILPELARQNGVGWQSGRIHHIGLTGFDAGPMIVGRENETGLVVDAVHVSYTPFGLFQKRLESITVSGLSLNVSVNDEGIVIAGIDLEKPTPPSGKASAKASAGSAVAVGRIRISSAVLNLFLEGETLRIPFDLTARLEPAGTIDAMLTLRPCGEKILLSTRWEQTGSHGAVSLTAASLSLEKLAAMVKALPPELTLSGDIDLQAGAAISLNPLKIEEMTGSLDATAFRVAYGDISLGTHPAGKETDTAFHLSVRQVEKKRFMVSGGNLVMQARVPLVIDNLKGAITLGPEATDVSLQAAVRVPAFLQAGTLPVALVEDVRLMASLSGGYAANSDWHLDITDSPAKGARKSEAIVLAMEDIRVAAGPPMYTLKMNGNRAGVEGRYSLSIPGVRANTPAGSVRMRRVALQGSVGIDASGEKILPAGTASLLVTAIEADMGAPGSPATVKVSIPEIRARAKMQHRPGENPVFRGDVRLAESSLAAPEYKVRMTGIGASIPWQWPVKKAGAKGRASIARMQWKHLDMGSMRMTVRQQADGIVYQGRHTSILLPELELDFSGAVKFPAADGIEAHVEAVMSRPESAAEIDLGQFFEAGAGVYAQGALSADVKGSYTAGRMRANACGRLDNTAIRMPAKDLVVENLSLGVCLPDLLQLTTGPSQTLTFGAAGAGNFKVENGVFHFQLEPHKTLFIEKGRVGWSGGQIRLQPMRITPGIDAYEARLDCDRLNLAQILEQLAIANAKGDGTVNGTIPISIKKGRIRFDDGFLYSTPGDGGKISLSGADAIMAGIPRGTRQFFQVDLAREALKDFNYKWAKLRLVSEKDALRMRLQFDGKPGKILPFEYNQEFGGFIRVDADSRGSDFEGISLDVNFRVPLNDLLQYKDLFR